MKEEYEFIEEMSSEYKDRNQFLKKYYPFFKITMEKANSLHESKLGSNKLETVDIGYLILSLLRYLVEENNFKSRGVSYYDISEYIGYFVDYTHHIILDNDEKIKAAGILIDVLSNGGQPYEYSYFDPKEQKKVTYRISYVRGEIDPVVGNLNYYITDAGIEFFLETKEMKELNQISIQQVLLEKMVSSSNFKGARKVVKRISNEVGKFNLMKKEVLDLMSINPVEGDKRYEEFYQLSMDWFNQEEDFFTKNIKALDYAREQVKIENGTEIIREINALSDELKRTSNKYGTLLSDMVDLKNKVDDLRSTRKIKVLRNTFDFNAVVSTMIQKDSADRLELLIAPLLQTKKRKFFDFNRIDTLLKFKVTEEEEIDVIEQEEMVDYVFDDEIELERIEYNHKQYVHCLFQLLEQKSSFDLKEYNEYLKEVFTDKVFYQGDYFSFLIALSGRNQYSKNEASEDNTGLLDSILKYEEKTGRFIPFEIEYMVGEPIVLSSGFQTTNLYVRRMI